MGTVNRWRRALPVGVLLAALTGASCGDDDGRARAAEDAARRAPTVTVVADLPLQGAAGAQARTLVAAMRLYLARQGGRAGAYRVRLETRDDASAAAGRWDGRRCRENARRSAGDARVVAVLGTLDSACTALELPILNEASVAMISPANTAAGLTRGGPGSAPGEPDLHYPSGTRTFARVVPPTDVQGAAAAQLMQKLGVESVYVLDDGGAYGRAAAEATAAAAPDYGIAVVGSERFDTGAGGYRDLYERVARRHPDAVYLGARLPADAGALLRDKVAALGDNDEVRLIAPDAFLDGDLVEPSGAGSAADGLYVTFGALGPEQLAARGGAAADFLKAYRARFGEPEVYTLYGAAAMQVALAAIAGSDGTRRSVVARLLGVEIAKRDSVLGEAYSFDENGDTTLKDVSVFRAKGDALPFDTALRVEPPAAAG